MAYTQNLNFDYNPPGANTSPFEILGQGMRQQREDEIAARKAQQAEQAQGFINRLNELKGKQMESELQRAPEMSKAKLALEKAKAKYYGQGGSRGGVSGSIWRSLPQNTRNDILAQGSAWGISPEVVAAHIGSGGTMGELKQQAEANGVDTEHAEKIYAPTTRNISEIKGQESRAAELDFLEQETAKDFSVYGRTFHGYSPQQAIDAMKGDEATKKKIIAFLGARALQPEINYARMAITGGSSAYEALRDAKEGALANINVPGWTITPEIREGVQTYINDRLRRGFQVRKKAMTGMKQEKQEKKVNERFGEMAGGPIRGMINGEEVDVDPNDIEMFKQHGGQING